MDSAESKQVPYVAQTCLGEGPVLVFAPHPDDEVFGCGGALAVHGRAGHQVNVLVMTDGAAQPGPQHAAAQDNPRYQESRDAAKVLGYPGVEFMNLPDRGLRYGERLIESMMHKMLATGAKSIYAPWPGEVHPDHRACAVCVSEAARRIGGDACLFYYELSAPMPRPNRLLDITRVLELKKRAMACFPSQLQARPYDQFITGLNIYRTYTLGAEVTAAEAYLAIEFNEAGRAVSMQGLLQGVLGEERHESLPLVSVIIRSMLRDELQDALASVARQTYANIEVILVDAAGTGHPGVGDWCGRFPLREISSAQPLDRSAAANAGLHAATGAYLQFLDDDDLLDPDHVALLVRSLLDEPGCLAAYAGVRVWQIRNGETLEQDELNSPFNRNRLLGANYIPIHAMLFSRELVEKGCCFDQELERYEDWDFWLQLLAFTDFLHVDRVTATYRNFGYSELPGTQVTERNRQWRRQFMEKWLVHWDAAQLADIFFALDDAYHLRRSRRELAACREACRHSSEQAEASSAAIRSCQGRNQELVNKLEHEMELAARLKRELSLMKASRSWRVTGPVRRVVRMFRSIGMPHRNH